MDTSLNRFRRIWGIAGLALISVTWRLWLPQRSFPQVPVVEFFGRLPDAVDSGAIGVMIASLCVSVCCNKRGKLSRAALLSFVAAAVLSMAIDQHRFQPWAYQFTLIAAVLATTKPAAAFSLLRLLTISIYLYSAWSKVDYSFVHTLGHQFLSAGWGIFGVQVDDWPEWSRIAMAASFPIAEAAIGLSLCFRRAWPIARWASVALHVALLLALGPFRLQHKSGVLVWNLYFIAQNLLLFREYNPGAASEPAPIDNPKSMLARAVIGFALVWPLLEPWAFCDHWSAWSVYSSRVERTSFFVHRSEKDLLPAHLLPFLEPATDDENWFLVRLDRWSLESLGAPLYPQNRFQLAAADGVARQFGLTRARAVIHSVANRWTGERTNTAAAGIGQLQAATNSYLLGAKSVRRLESSRNSPRPLP